MNHFDVIRRPIITEKATILKEEQATLCFEVAHRATAAEIKAAVEKIFDVEVDNVRVMNVPGKRKRLGRYEGYARGWKKAYVKLAPDQKMIEYFEGV